MKKRILSAIITVITIISLCMSFAAPAMAGTHINVAQIVGKDSYTSLQDAIDNAEIGDTVKLLANVSESVTVNDDKEITLDLNGTVFMPDYENANLNPQITNNGKLTVTDSNKTASHNFVIDEFGKWILTEETRGAVPIGNLTAEPEEGGIVTVEGGVITGCFCTSGTIRNNNQLTLEAGSIINAANAVYVSKNSEFTMSGGLIEFCDFSAGAGVFCSGSFIMNGGKIMYNEAADGAGLLVDGEASAQICGNAEISHNDGINGGGIMIREDAECTVSGNAKIEYNEATFGGGINFIGSSLLVKENASVSHNSAFNNIDGEYGNGGGIYCNSESVFLEGVTLSNNYAENEGGAVFITKDGACVADSAVITENTADINGAGVFVDNDGGSCFAEGTKITMADGMLRNIQDVHYGDCVMTFDHETGKLSSEKVIFEYYGEDVKNYFTLNFTNGISLNIVTSHSLLERDSRQYVIVSEDNANSFVGKYFYNAQASSFEQLLSVTKGEPCNYYAIYTAHHINCIANGMISVPDDAAFRMNTFELDENLKIDSAKKQQDIETYGLTDYEDYKDIVDWEYFDAFNDQYDHISVCKGLVTKEEIIRLASDRSANATGMEPMLMMTTAQPALLNTQLTPELGLSVGGNTRITGNTVSGNENNVFLSADCMITVLEGYNGTVGVTTDTTPEMDSPVTVTNVNTADYSKYFKSDDEASYKIYSLLDGEDYATILSVHEHKWNYIVDSSDKSGATIIAYCSEEFGAENNCTNYSKTNGETLTILAPEDITYSGEIKYASIMDNKTSLGEYDELPEIAYQYKKSILGKYSFVSEVREAGYYVASITVEEATASVSFRITDGSEVDTVDTIKVHGSLLLKWIFGYKLFKEWKALTITKIISDTIIRILDKNV